MYELRLKDFKTNMIENRGGDIKISIKSHLLDAQKLRVHLLVTIR